MTDPSLPRILRRALLGATIVCFAATSLAQDTFQYDRLDRDDLFRRLRKVTRDDAERRQILQQMFEEAGCKGSDLVDQPVENADLANLVCTLPGDTSSRIIVGAHFDADPAGDGAVDNWTGAVLLPSLYQSLRSRPRRHTYVFIAFSGGEAGDLGAKDYANGLDKSQVRDTVAMVNLESLGLTRTLSWQYGGERNLHFLIRQVAETIMLPVDSIKPKELGKVDAEFFAKRNIPSIVLHSVSKYNHEILHSPDDTLEAVKRDEYYESYMLSASFLAFLDLKL